MRVFFSHSSRDKALLRELRGYLPPWLSSWIDEDELLFGAKLEPSLRQAIDEQVDFVVLFLGREAVESDWVRRELSWALEREERLGRVFVLPVLLVEVQDKLDELGLGGRVFIHLSDFSRDSTKMLADNLTNQLGGWLSEMLTQARATSNRATTHRRGLNQLSESAIAAITSVPTVWQDEVETILIGPFLQQIASTQIGQIPLTPAQYYQRILLEMGRAEEGWEIFAVSTLTSMLWTTDLDQTRYAQRNLAAVERGASIYRIFVVGEGTESEFRSIVEAQLDCGVHVKMGTNRVFAHVSDLEDFVLFATPNGTRGLVAHPTIDGSRRVRSGMLDLSESGTSRLQSIFREVWDVASLSEDVFSRVDRAPSPRTTAESQAPGRKMQVHRLSAPVVSCEEAASARGIPLANELKTLLLQTHNGLVAAHLPGDGTLSLRKVKDRLETAEAYLADPEDLLELGLSSGTVCAVLDPVWTMPHLVSRRVLDLPEVMTNNGTRTGYFAFAPTVLMAAKDVIVGDFER